MSTHLGDERDQAIDKLGPPRLEEIDRGVFAYIQPDGTWWINNTGFVTGTDGVVAVDSCATERRTRAFLDAVARSRRNRSASSSTPTTTATTPTATT